MDLLFYIDMFQNTKKTVINNIIVDQTLNKAAHEFVDTQTAFAKRMIKNGQDVSKYFMDTQVANWFPKGAK